MSASIILKSAIKESNIIIKIISSQRPFQPITNLLQLSFSRLIQMYINCIINYVLYNVN